MSKKKTARLRRATKLRSHIRELGIPRLSIFRSPRHIYAQVVSSSGERIEAAASTLESDLKGQSSGNIQGAIAVGSLIAERAKSKGIEKVAFDRSGYKYHGRIKALADAARTGGLKF